MHACSKNGVKTELKYEINFYSSLILTNEKRKSDKRNWTETLHRTSINILDTDFHRMLKHALSLEVSKMPLRRLNERLFPSPKR